MEMKKNEIYTATCTGYSSEGAGVTRINDVVIFVPGLLAGEEAEIGITKMKSSYGYGRVVKILRPSEEWNQSVLCIDHVVDVSCSIWMIMHSVNSKWEK